MLCYIETAKETKQNTLYIISYLTTPVELCVLGADISGTSDLFSLWFSIEEKS